MDEKTIRVPGRFGKDRRLIAVLCFVALFAFLTYCHAFLKILIVEPNFGDFANYYFNATKLNEGVNVYALTESEEVELRGKSGIPVNVCAGPGYAPVIQFLFGLLAKLDFWNALTVWLVLNHVLYVALIFTIPALGGKDPVTFFAGFFFLFASQPFIENIGLGQTNLIILFLLTAVLLLYVTGRSKVLCGLLIALVLIMKPQYGLVPLFFLWKREYRLVLSAVVCYLLLRIAGLMIYGFEVEAAFWSHLFSRSGLLDLASISMKGILDRFLYEIPHGAKLSLLSYLLISVTLLFASLCVISRKGSNCDFLAEFSLLLPLVILICPISYEHYLVVLFIPFMAIIGRSELKGFALVPFAAAFCLASLRYSFDRFNFFSTGWPALLSAGKTAGVLLVWLILFLQLTQRRGSASTIHEPPRRPLSRYLHD
jgi:hypothetical protein